MHARLSHNRQQLPGRTPHSTPQRRVSQYGCCQRCLLHSVPARPIPCCHPPLLLPPPSLLRCGPNYGSGTPVDEIDACCKSHDDCYDSSVGYNHCSCDQAIVRCLNKITSIQSRNFIKRAMRASIVTYLTTPRAAAASSNRSACLSRAAPAKAAANQELSLPRQRLISPYWPLSATLPDVAAFGANITGGCGLRLQIAAVGCKTCACSALAPGSAAHYPTYCRTAHALNSDALCSPSVTVDIWQHSAPGKHSQR